jgi:DNA polymerase III delta subunit
LSSQLAQIYLLTGSDPTQIFLEADKLMLQLAGPSPDPFSCDIIQEDDGGPSPELLRRLLRSLDSPSFMGGSKIIWLKHYSGFAGESDSESEGKTKSKGRGGKDDLLKELTKRIQDGLPNDIVLVMDGPGCDRRKAFTKACEAKGEARFFNRPDLGKKAGLYEMSAILRRTAADKGVNLARDAEQYLLEALGGDTSLLDGELEKLVCYCGGPGQTITREAVEQLCLNRAEEQVWALGNCLGKRDLRDTLSTVDNLVSSSKDGDRTARSLILNAANYFRQALGMLLFMVDHKLKTPQEVNYFLTNNPEIGKGKPRGSIESMHPFRAMMIAEQAKRYTPAQMIQAIKTLRDALWQTTSSSIKPQMALENALLKIIGKQK